MPSGPGVIAWPLIAEIAATVPPGVATFLLTCATDPEQIIEQHRHARTTTLQLCDRLAPRTYAKLRAALPGIGIVQVVHVEGEDAVAEARAVAPEVDAILLDSGRPTAAVKELGGTGRTHDWAVSRRVREVAAEARKPIYLAGGLRPGNLGEAIGTVRPFGVDVCSGVRTDGRLDPEKLTAFMAAVLRA
jgi:phosphoribosylanthranilate isomerase